MRVTANIDKSVRCTASGCSCVSFTPGRAQLRLCDCCGHGWVAHAVEQLRFPVEPPSSCSPVEVALPGAVSDLSSLVLYGTHAVPVRLKILLDRLYSVLSPDQVGCILHTLGWCLGDYVRGYMLQCPGGKVLDCWSMVTPEEELLILKQFLRFGETRPLVELMTAQCLSAINPHHSPEFNSSKRSCQSNTRTFFERNHGTPEAYGFSKGSSVPCCYKEKGSVHDDESAHHVRCSSLSPLRFPSTNYTCLTPSIKEFPLPDRRHQQAGEKQEHRSSPVLQKHKDQIEEKIKIDTESKCPRQHLLQRRDLHVLGSTANQESASSALRPLNSALIPASAPLHSTVSCSNIKTSRKMQKHSYHTLTPLPPFSSSFLCRSLIPSLSLPSPVPSLLPSPLCSNSSLPPVGGRKGRVCCGVCGKSFYDKGTLKIHYNAVHLKIKHHCTVAGCSMVFSSLRSRNRHSANPNPRLHTSGGRDTHTPRQMLTELNQRDFAAQVHNGRNSQHSVQNTHWENDCNSSIWKQEDNVHILVHSHPVRDLQDHQGRTQPGLKVANTPASSPSSILRPLSQNFAHNFTQMLSSDHRAQGESQTPTLSTQGLPHPFAPLDINLRNKKLPNLITEPLDSTLSGLNMIKLSGCSVTPPVSQERFDTCDPIPKKKPRKSSMPVKIKQERTQQETDEE